MKVEPNRVFVSLTLVLAILLCGTHYCLAQEKHKGVKTVMIDPGHGGKDPGTVYGNYREKDINLSVALLLGDLITKNFPDVKVHYTRKTDVFVDLYKRGDMANKAGADLFISIHVNAVDVGKTAPSGALTLVMGQGHENANLDVAMRENDVISYEDDYSTKYEGYTPGSAESFIIFSLMQYVHIDQSMNFANIIQKHYKKSTPMPDRGARQQKLLVLWKTAMPGVLTELGFLSNAEDRKVLTSASGQKQLATALFNAFSEYKSKVEGNTSPLQLDVPSSSGETTSISAARQETVVYRIQVSTSSRKLGMNGTLLKQYKNLGVTEKKVGEVYKYYVGNCKKYSEAAELQKTVRKTTSDAFMVAFKGEEQIPLTEARRLTE